VQIRARERGALHRAGQAIAALDPDQVLQLVIAESKPVGAEGRLCYCDHDRGDCTAVRGLVLDLLGLRLLAMPASPARSCGCGQLVEDARRDPVSMTRLTRILA
jgi:hypothetical protein